MIEFVDKSSTQAGTPINRANLMAIQGFVTKTTVFDTDGSITGTKGAIVETNNDKTETLTTVFKEDGSITETFKGKYTITKTTTFTDNGVMEVLSQ